MKEKIKLILKSVRQYKKYAIATPIFMVFEAAMECLLPFVMSMLIDCITDACRTIPPQLTRFEDIFKVIKYTNPNLGFSMDVTVFGLIMVAIGMCIVSIISGILGGRFAAKASVGLGANLRSDLYAKIQSFSFANIDKFSSSSLVTRLTTDISNVQMAFQMCIRIVIRAPLMMIFSAVMAFICGGVLAWIFIVLIPIVGFALFIIMKKAMRIFRRVFKRYDKVNESVQENVSGIRVVKSYVREEFEKSKFNTASDNMTKDFIKGEIIVAYNFPVLNTAVHLSNILVIFLGTLIIYLCNKDIQFPYHLTVGQMSSLLTYGIQILMNLQMISMILVMLVMSIECVRRIGEVLEEEPTIKNCEDPLYEVPNGNIVFKNVSFKYAKDAEKNSLEHVNLNIKSGQFIGVIGSTGSGKTTLVNLISRLYDITEGKLTVAGKDVDKYDLKTLRDNVAVVLQKNVLFSGTIRSNLQWGNENATDEEMWKALDIAQASDIVRQSTEYLDKKVEQEGANFSGGQKQRLCIARAILKKPKILILDDSTSAVDTKTDSLIRKGLKEDLPAMTKIVIAQRISSIEGADQIVILDDGKVNAIGTHEDLLKSNDIYKEIYYTQNKIGGNK